MIIISIYGHNIYLQFNKVVILEQVIRQSGVDSAQNFRQLLLRLRNGTIIHDDWQTLLQRSPHVASNAAHFDDAIRLSDSFTTKQV